MTPLTGFLHADLLRDRGAKLLHMGDHSDHPSAVRQLAKRTDHLLQRTFVERSESLVDENRVNFDSARKGCNDVRKSKCQGQRREERFSARKR